MAGSIKGIIVEIGGDTSGLQKALSKVNSATSSLSRELRGINSLLRLDPKNTELLAQKQDVLNEKILSTENKLKTLKDTYNETVKAEIEGRKISEENWRAIQREIIKTENELKQLRVQSSNWTKAGIVINEFGNKVKNLGKNITSVNQKISNLSEKLGNIGSKINKTVTLPMIALGTSTATTAVKFLQLKENTRTAFKVLLGSAEEAEKMLNDLYTFAKTTPFSYDTYLTAGKTLVAMGVSAQNCIPYLEKLTNASIATGAGQEGINTLTEAIGRMSSKGKIQLEELNRMIELGVPAVKILGNAYKKSEEQIYDMMSKGQLLAKDALPKLLEGMNNGTNGVNGMTSAYGGLASEMKGTLSGVLDSLRSKFRNLSMEVWDAENAYPELTEAIKEFTGTLDVVPKLFKSISKAVAPAMKTLNSKLKELNKYLDKANPQQLEKVGTAILKLAAAGPVISMTSKLLNVVTKLGSGFGSIVSGTGKAIQGIGNFSQAIAVAMNKTTSTNDTVNKLARILTNLTSPTGLAVTAITAVGGAMLYLATKETEAQKEARKFAEEMSNSKQALEEYNANIDKTRDANLSHIESSKLLRDELKELVDENGKVKKGYEGRVSFILNELNETLGTEYKLNGDIIESYKNLQDEIDKTIDKKKAEIILNAKQEKYKNAIENQSEAVEGLRKAQEDLGMSYDEVREKYGKYIDKINNNTLTAGDAEEIGSTVEYNKIRQLAKLSKAYEDAEWKVKEYTSNIKSYEEEYAKFTEGKYNEISNTITVATENWSSKSLEQINKSIQEQEKALEQYKTIYTNTGNEIAKQNAEQAQKNLDELCHELADKTRTLEELGKNEIEAWKSIASESYSSYSIEIAKMPPEMQKKIQEATGIIAGGTPQMQEKAEELGRKTIEEFDKSADAKQKALNTITGYLNGLTDDEKRGLLKQAGIENADKVLEQLNRGDLSEENGKNILKGLWNGLKNNNWQGKILGTASGLAKAVNKAFTGKDGWDEHSPSKKMKKYAEYYIQPISDVMKAKQSNIISSAKNLANKVNSAFNQRINGTQIKDFGKIQGNLTNKIIDKTNTIFTTPQIVFNVQELDETKLQQCFNYINRKFGSAY